MQARDDNDTRMLKLALHPEVEFTYVDPRHGKFHAVSLNDYLDMQTAAFDQHYKYNFDILSVDITGNTAVVKVKNYFRKHKASITDYIFLIKIKGNWIITHKSSYKEPRALLLPV